MWNRKTADYRENFLNLFVEIAQWESQEICWIKLDLPEIFRVNVEQMAKFQWKGLWCAMKC